MLYKGKYGFLNVMNKDYVNFGDFVRKEIGSCQEYSRYVDGAIEGYDNLGKGLRFEGNTNSYHSLKIHKNDAGEFVKRVKDNIKKRLEENKNDCIRTK